MSNQGVHGSPDGPRMIFGRKNLNWQPSSAASQGAVSGDRSSALGDFTTSGENISDEDKQILREEAYDSGRIPDAITTSMRKHALGRVARQHITFDEDSFNEFIHQDDTATRSNIVNIPESSSIIDINGDSGSEYAEVNGEGMREYLRRNRGDILAEYHEFFAKGEEERAGVLQSTSYQQMKGTLHSLMDRNIEPTTAAKLHAVSLPDTPDGELDLLLGGMHPRDERILPPGSIEVGNAIAARKRALRGDPSPYLDIAKRAERVEKMESIIRSNPDIDREVEAALRESTHNPYHGYSIRIPDSLERVAAACIGDRSGMGRDELIEDYFVNKTPIGRELIQRGEMESHMTDYDPRTRSILFVPTKQELFYHNVSP